MFSIAASNYGGLMLILRELKSSVILRPVNR